MGPAEMSDLRQWVSGYIKGFSFTDPEDIRNISLKEVHTYRVADNMTAIAGAIFRDNSRVLIAEAIGLLHDIGRFPQYRQYRTYRDSISTNHGRLGTEVLKEQNALSAMAPREQELISDSVLFHNAFSVPENLDNEKISYIRMIRDADKLDIWRIFSEQFSMDEKDRATAAGLGLPDSGEYSDSIVDCLRERRQATLAGLKTLTEFKIMQLTWVYDLNYDHSFRLLSESGHMDRIIAMLPNDSKISKAVSVLKEYIGQRCSC
jgi:hypothetical protein